MDDDWRYPYDLGNLHMSNVPGVSTSWVKTRPNVVSLDYQKVCIVFFSILLGAFLKLQEFPSSGI